MNDFYQQVSDMLRAGEAAAAVTKLERWLAEHEKDEIARSLLGSALMRDDREAAALETFRRNASDNPGSYAAQGDVGFAEMQVGNDEAAMAAFAAAVVLNPQFYQAHVYLSRLRFRAGELELAKQALAGAEACDPLAAEFRNVQAAMSSSRLAEAEKICRALLAKQPGYPKAAYTLAHLATTVGAHEESAEILARALDFFPCDVNLRAALVNSLEEIGDYEAQRRQASQLVALDRNAPAAWLILGRVQGHCGHYEESLTAYDKALELSRTDPAEVGRIELLRGHALKVLGRYEDCIAAYRASIEKVDNNGAGWWGLADMKVYRFDDEDIEAMQAIVDAEFEKPEQRSQAAFALGKAMEDTGEYEASFTSYEQANSLRPGIRYDPDENRTGIDELIRTMSVQRLNRGTKIAPNGPTPIFITGLPRSGSTLIEQILASHSMIEGTMELVNLPNLMRLVTIDGGKRNEDYPESLGSFSTEELRDYGQKYLDSTAVYRTDRPYFIDKLPTNFDKIGFIHMILPNAVIIDARRHPMDCGFSCYKQHFAGGHHFSYKLEHIASYYNDYLRLMDHWEDVLPGKVLTVRYEELVADPETMTRRLLGHVGVPFEEECLRFFENKRPVRTASSEQVRQPIYKQAVAHWKHFEKQLEPLASALGETTLARFERG